MSQIHTTTSTLINGVHSSAQMLMMLNWRWWMSCNREVHWLAALLLTHWLGIMKTLTTSTPVAKMDRSTTTCLLSDTARMTMATNTGLSGIHGGMTGTEMVISWSKEETIHCSWNPIANGLQSRKTGMEKSNKHSLINTKRKLIQRKLKKNSKNKC